MRKLGLNRRTGGAKAVLPPMIPGSGGGNESVDPIYSTAQVRAVTIVAQLLINQMSFKKFCVE